MSKNMSLSDAITKGMSEKEKNRDFDSVEAYVVEGRWLNKLVEFQKKLYSMQGLKHDEQRDLAHIIGLMFEEVQKIKRR